MTSRTLTIIALATISLHATAAVHGPIVQWYESPQHRASVRWIETAESGLSDGNWQVGRGGFGYGDADDATILRDMEGRFETLSIRRRMAVPEDLPDASEIVLLARYDDAFLLWIDGKEWVRRNVRIVDGKEQVIQKHEAEEWEEIPLGSAASFRKSKVLAATGFNDGLNSSDFTLDLKLVAITPAGRRELIPDGAEWEYLAGSEPATGWQWTTRHSNKPGQAEPPKFGYRLAGTEAWTEQEARRRPFAGTAHQVAAVELDGLPAGAAVEFRLGETTHRFRTAPEDLSDLRFVTGGDMFHERQWLDAMNARAGAEDPSFALLGGDLAYTNDEKHERWFEWIDSWVEHARTPDGHLLPMVVAIGNHEVKGANFRPDDAPGPEAATEFYSLFGVPVAGKANQAIDFGGGLSLILLDSGHTATLAAQVDWLETQLSNRKEVPRLFVCYHRPAWGCGTKENSIEIQKAWCPSFERHRVDAVFENDHHVFSRTYPIRAGKRDDANGVPYLGAGSWGVRVRTIPENAFEESPYLAAAEGVNHLYLIQFRPDGWTATVKTADGRVIDRSDHPWRR